MDVIELRRPVKDHCDYAGTFVNIANERIRGPFEAELRGGLLWPELLAGLNPKDRSGYRIGAACRATLV